MEVPSFRCTEITRSAVTYRLSPDGYGWAIATVNDSTGELSIQSDWGCWSHRWSVENLGRTADSRPLTLTEFIGDRGGGHYLADKLTPREDRERFDAEATVRELRRTLVQRRIDAARLSRDVFGSQHIEDVAVEVRGAIERWPLDAETVRSVYDQLDELESEDNPDAFYDAFFRVEGWPLVTDQPWEHARTRPVRSYLVLLHGILPALMAACRQGATTT